MKFNDKHHFRVGIFFLLSSLHGSFECVQLVHCCEVKWASLSRSLIIIIMADGDGDDDDDDDGIGVHAAQVMTKN